MSDRVYGLCLLVAILAGLGAMAGIVRLHEQRDLAAFARIRAESAVSFRVALEPDAKEARAAIAALRAQLQAREADIGHILQRCVDAGRE